MSEKLRLLFLVQMINILHLKSGIQVFLVLHAPSLPQNLAKVFQSRGRKNRCLPAELSKLGLRKGTRGDLGGGIPAPRCPQGREKAL